MNGVELFACLKQVSSITELLQSVNGKTKAEKQSKCGNIYEKVWDLVIKFGYYPLLPNDTYDHYQGNINICKIKKISDLKRYLETMLVFSKGKGGSSDITLQHKDSGKWVFISSKFYMDDNKKSIDSYDVEKILAVIKQHSYKYKQYDIYLLVNDKQKVSATIASCKSTNNYITENISHILDINDLEVCFQRFKTAIQNVSFETINGIFGNTKIPLELRFHQDLITYKQIMRIQDGEKELLLGAKARSGKTYCIGGLFIKYYKQFNTLNGLIITPAPTETISQFTDDLFHKFRDFNRINIVEIKKGRDFETMVLQENNIIIVSKQLLDDYVFEERINSIYMSNLDFIVFDENHFHGTTQMSKNIIQSYSSEKTVKVYLTATYAKPLNEWLIPLNCQFYWDIEDEQLCKNRNITGLIEKYGESVSLFVTKETAEDKLSVYDNMPNLELLTSIMDRTRYDVIKEKIKDSSYGFSNSALLSGNYPNEVDTILRYITGSNKEEDYPQKDLSIFGRIKRKCIESDSRTKLNNGDFSSQLWFLPYGINLQICKVSEHLKDRMLKNPILRNYEIKIVNSKKEYKLEDIKKEIENWEIKAKEDGKDGLILLAGNQLTLGITLPFVDIVFLFNDILSSDKIIQMMYRCMTETDNNKINKINNGRKRMGFVVDLNISRVINTLIDYGIYNTDLNTHQKLTYIVENNLINIDSDLFRGKENKTQLVEKLMQIWKGDPINTLRIMLRKIEENVIDLDTRDQQVLNQYFTSSLGDENMNVTVKFDEESDEKLPKGRNISKEGYNESVDKDCESINDNISLSKDVLPFILPLSCILTMNTEYRDILEMLHIIKSNPYLLCVFNDQSFIWWNKKDIITLVETMVAKYIQKNSSIYNITIQLKMSLESLIDKPKDLLEMIDSCLKPKQKEKQENGEVFTPMNIVFEMLDNLDKHYTSQHGRSIFTEKDFTWFDPAAGMGNFPVGVYLKLMDGLQSQIPDDAMRKQHIIENMLYMCELNKKNVFICNQIFNLNNEYNLHIHEGDTLQLNLHDTWGMEPHSFDVVLGNPPYNKGGIRSHTGKQLGEKNETMWTKFVEGAFEWLKPGGYLLFINPLSWLKKSHSLHNRMLEKHIVWLKLWDNSQSKGAINADIPISLYILHNTTNIRMKQTEITSVLKRRNLTTKSNEYLNPKHSIPLAFHSIFHKLIHFIETHNCQLEYKTKTVKSTGTKERLPTNYTGEDMWAVDTYTLKVGLMVKRATEKHPDANERKLIIANKASFAGAFIDDGRLSLTGNHKFYIIGDRLEFVQDTLTFKICEIISHYTKYGQDFLDSESFKYLPDLRKLGITDITEDEFYELVGFTKQEINWIKNPSFQESNTNNEEVNRKIPLTKSTIPRKIKLIG